MINITQLFVCLKISQEIDQYEEIIESGELIIERIYKFSNVCS